MLEIGEKWPLEIECWCFFQAVARIVKSVFCKKSGQGLHFCTKKERCMFSKSSYTKWGGLYSKH